jgi:hypothetical protein
MMVVVVNGYDLELTDWTGSMPTGSRIWSGATHKTRPMTPSRAQGHSASSLGVRVSLVMAPS